VRTENKRQNRGQTGDFLLQIPTPEDLKRTHKKFQRDKKKITFYPVEIYVIRYSGHIISQAPTYSLWYHLPNIAQRCNEEVLVSKPRLKRQTTELHQRDNTLSNVSAFLCFKLTEIRQTQELKAQQVKEEANIRMMIIDRTSTD